jgi:DNA helicase-2/ATP-dependent DNA helicase PcrA
MDRERIFDGLNPEQRRAVEAVRGPVCILAGAGSGKTTTITRRIANQVATGAFRPEQILAVTFTDKAAGEMRSRLASLGVAGIRARTFHAAALAQVRHFRPDSPARILASKALWLRQIGNTLPRPYRFRPAGDLATEVEWAKNRRLVPDAYRAGLGEHEPPIPVDLMHRVYLEYERRKEAQGWIDFEDLLELAIRILDDDDTALAEVRDRYRAFTVDEYQDVNVLQQTLLERWLGPRDELCVVGDDYQSIYAFTAATPEYLLGLPQRFPHATVVRLESNYRSSPQVLELANRLVPRLGGAEKRLRAVRPGGPEPSVGPSASTAAEGELVVERIRGLHAEGLPLEEIALLVRTNARGADFEEVFGDAGIPFQGSALLERDAARQLLKRLRGAGSRSPAAEVRRVALEQGWLEDPPDGLGERELTRQNDLARLVRLASEFDDGEATVAGFVADLEARFGRSGTAATGVHLLTYHRAKGLEFEAVFLPRLEERELPSRQAKTDAALAEERRLLYVGMTRARRHLFLSWSGRPSRFLRELGVAAAEPPPERRPADAELPPSVRSLKAWRLGRARADDVPAYVVFTDRTLEAILRRAPTTTAELADVPGVGEAKVERYGPELLDAVREACAAGPLPDGFTLARPPQPAAPDGPVYSALAVWRLERATRDGVPPFHVFSNRVLEAIATAMPTTLGELVGVSGVGPAKLERFGEEVLAELRACGEQQVEHERGVAANPRPVGASSLA